MSERMLLVTSWTAIVAAMCSMIIGHTGSPGLDWMTNQISTYAATAPRQEWITGGMLLPCVAFACISMLISRHRLLGNNGLAHAAPMLAGAAIAGLLTLAVFKETAPTMAALSHAGLGAIRQQSFHDAGLMVFFYSTIMLVVLCGGLAIVSARGWGARTLGATAILLGLSALPLMATSWPRMIGITASAHGLQQRASLFALWLAAALVLAAPRPLSTGFSRVFARR